MNVNFTPSAPRERINSNPVTTRDQFAELLRALVDPLNAGFSKGFARVLVGNNGAAFDDTAAQFEGFARPLWGLAPLLAGGGEYVELGRWQEGLRNGADPNHSEYWGKCVDLDQRFVEMAAVGFSLAIAPESFWTPLSKTQQENLTLWLLEINEHVLHENNWRFFKVLVNLGLRKVGARYSQSAIDDTLDYIEIFYDEETGWPTDGPRPETERTDYYSSSFAIPYYTLLYSKLAAEIDPKRCSLYRARAVKMALDVVHLFGPDGASIAFGRSMIYRFAMSGFWAAVAFAELELPAPLTWGVVKGLLLRNIRWFTARASVFNADGTMTIGYTYPNQFMAESYNSPQSPYWCLKAFAPLALPASHPFWTSNEEPYPDSLLQVTRIVKPALQVFSHAAGHTFLLTSGQYSGFVFRHGAEKYAKFAYSSAFGFSVPTAATGLGEHALDSTLGLCDDQDGERWRVCRRRMNIVISHEGVISSEWEPWPDVTVKTWLIPPASSTSGFHLRIHKVTTSRQLKTADGAFALLNQVGPLGSRHPIPIISSNPYSADAIATSGSWSSGGEALQWSSAGVVGIKDLSPSTTLATRTGNVQASDVNSNLVEPKTSIAMLHGDLAPGDSRVFVSAIFAIPFVEGVGRPDWWKGWKEVPAVPSFVV